MSFRLFPARAGSSLAAPASVAAATGVAGALSFAARPSSAQCDAPQDATQILDPALERSWEDINWLNDSTAPQSSLPCAPVAAPASAVERNLSVAADNTPTQSMVDAGRYRPMGMISLAPPSREEIQQASAVVETWMMPSSTSFAYASSAGSSSSSPSEVEESMELADRAMKLAESVTGTRLRPSGRGSEGEGSSLSLSFSSAGSVSQVSAYDPGFRNRAAQMLVENKEEVSNLVQDMWPTLLSNRNALAILEKHTTPGSSPLPHHQPADEAHSCTGTCTCTCSGAQEEETAHLLAKEREVGGDEKAQRVVGSTEEPQRMEDSQPSAEKPAQPPPKQKQGWRKGWKKEHRSGSKQHDTAGGQAGWGSDFKGADPGEGFREWASSLMALVVLVVAVIFFGRARGSAKR